MLAIVVGVLALPVPAAPASESTGTGYAVTRLLLSASDFDVRLGAKTLFRMESTRTPALLDLAAEVMWSGCAGSFNLDVDTLAWLSRGIGASKQARYLKLYDFCIAKTSAEGLRKWFDLAKEATDGKATSSFEPGTVNLAQMRTKWAKAEPDGAAAQRVAASFPKVHSGMPLDEVYALLGVPYDLRGANYLREENKDIQAARDSLVEYAIDFAYKGSGVVRFFYDPKGRTDWWVANVFPGPGSWDKDPAHVAAANADIIRNGSPFEIKILSQKLIDQTVIDRATLDLIANRLSSSRGEQEGEMADSLAWLCKVIRHSRDGRYKALMVQLSTDAARDSLRKHAARAAADLPDSSEPPYVPAASKNPGKGP